MAGFLAEKAVLSSYNIEKASGHEVTNGLLRAIASFSHLPDIASIGRQLRRKMERPELLRRGYYNEVGFQFDGPFGSVFLAPS